MSTPPVSDGAFARWLAGAVGEELLTLREQLGFADPQALRDAGDARAHEHIVAALAQARPGDAVLSEEGRDEAARLHADRLWIVDPLDGTREFAEPGRTDWAVHIGLWQRRSGLTAGAVALPAQHRVLATDRPPAYPPLASSGDGPLRLVVCRSRPPEFVAAVAAEVAGELVPMGSAGAKIAAVITGEADAYLHAGGQYEWDSAAPVAVASATGLHTSRIDGTALEYNQADPRLPDLLVCRRDLASRLLAAVRRHRDDHAGTASGAGAGREG